MLTGGVGTSLFSLFAIMSSTSPFWDATCGGIPGYFFNDGCDEGGGPLSSVTNTVLGRFLHT